MGIDSDQDDDGDERWSQHLTGSAHA